MPKAKVKDILTYATENKFGVAAINTLNIETVKYVIEAAERERVPIIVQFYPGFSDYTDLKHLAFAACDMAEKASIPVGVHLDHSVTYEIAVGGIRDGFPSVMIDGSTKSFQENVELTKNVVRVAKVFGVDVEAELGHVGNGDSIDARDLGSHEDEFEKMKAGEESFETIPEYKSSVEKMIQLLDYANEDSLALGYDQAINDFANGEGWMFLQGSWTLPSFLSANPDFNVEFTILPNDNGKPIATQAVDTGFCVNAKVADEPEKMEAIDKFLSFALSAEGAQIYTDNDKSPSCVTGVKAEVPQFQPFFDYVEANGFEADGAYPPTGFEDTKRGKIQNVLLDKDVDAFLKEMTNDWNQAVEDSK